MNPQDKLSAAPAAGNTAPATVQSGVNRFEGIFSKWYGWASLGTTYREGPLRVFKFQARRDADRLAAKLRTATG